jgi:hypothetical protein
MPREPGCGSKRRQDVGAQRTRSERMPRRHPRTSGDGAGRSRPAKRATFNQEPDHFAFLGGVNLIFLIISTIWPSFTWPDTAVIALTTLT